MYGANIGKTSNTYFQNTCDSPTFEKLNIKLGKYFLCIGKYSGNVAVRANGIDSHSWF